MTATSDIGVEGFIAGLRRCGQNPVLDADVVTFTVEPATGPYTGTDVPSGVSIDELAGWPAIPPHWVHLPGHITFVRSNTQTSPKPGWIKHSRQIGGWGNAAEPAQAWISHARAVIGEST